MNQDFLDHFYIVKMNGWKEEEAISFWNKYYGEILKKVNINPVTKSDWIFCLFY